MVQTVYDAYEEYVMACYENGEQPEPFHIWCVLED